jgi:hypothetical protein
MANIPLNAVCAWFECCKYNTWYNYNNIQVNVNDLFKLYPDLINVRDAYGRTAAFYCNKDYDFIYYLSVDQLNVIDYYNKSVLDLALWRQPFNHDMFNQLIKMGARFNPDPKSFVFTLDRLMTHYSRKFIVQCVIDELIDPNVYIKDEPLLYIITRDEISYFPTLINLGANAYILLCGFYLFRCCHYIRSQSVDVARVLIDSGTIMSLSLIRNMIVYHSDNNDFILEIMYLYG